MGTSSAELVVPFVGALQASVSVLLTIFYGVLAAQFNLLSRNGAKEVSNTCVRMFLPALLIFKVGSELQQGTAMRYLPILSMRSRFNMQKSTYVIHIKVIVTNGENPLSSLGDILQPPIHRSRCRHNSRPEAS